MSTAGLLGPHTQLARDAWLELRSLRRAGSFGLSGHGLSAAQVVAVAQRVASADLDSRDGSGLPTNGGAPGTLEARLARSVDALNAYLARDWTVYGVNTGFGGSADARTAQLEALQVSLMQHTQSGIIASAEKGESAWLGGGVEKRGGHDAYDDHHHDDHHQPNGDGGKAGNGEKVMDLQRQRRQHDTTPLPLSTGGTTFPAAWARAAMLVRLNQNLRGHSAVRLEVLALLAEALRRGLAPLIPLRGSISASGDLMPMSYVAGLLVGNPDVYVSCPVDVGGGTVSPEETTSATATVVLPADEALRRHGLAPVTLGPKEGLGLINGTAASCAVAAVALHESHRLAVVVQALTAFAAEALAGNVEWLSPFVHDVARPHPGQVEAAANMRALLRGSRLVSGLPADDDRGAAEAEGGAAGRDRVRRSGEGALCQDRYALRTAPQWVGPYLEDLELAQRQLATELNSSSDNPLVDADHGEVYSGGNFQAASVTSAVEKARLALQMLGRLVFSQCTELVNPALSNGLPANLAPPIFPAPSHPSATATTTTTTTSSSPPLSFAMKGVDVNVAAYASELASLAHPVSAHVLSAEMHNQGVNSLALISARRTADAADLLAHLVAAHLYVLAQAAELRAWDADVRAWIDNKVRVWLMNPSPPPPAQRVGEAMEPPLAPLHDAVLARVARAAVDAWADSGALPTAAERLRRADLAARGVLAEALVQALAPDAVGDDDGASKQPHGAIADGNSSAAAARCYAQLLGARGVLDARALAAEVGSPGGAAGADAVGRRLGRGARALLAHVRGALGVPFHGGVGDQPLFGDGRVGAHGGEEGGGDGAAWNQEEEKKKKKTIGSWVSVVYESVRRGEVFDVVMACLDEDARRAEEAGKRSGADGEHATGRGGMETNGTH